MNMSFLKTARLMVLTSVLLLNLYLSLVGWAESPAASDPFDQSAKVDRFDQARSEAAFLKEINGCLQYAQAAVDSSLKTHLSLLVGKESGDKLFRTLEYLKDRKGLAWLNNYIDDNYLINYIYYRGSMPDFEQQVARIAKILELNEEKTTAINLAQWEFEIAWKAGAILSEIQSDTLDRFDNAWTPIAVNGPNAESLMSRLDDLPLAKLHPVAGYGVTYLSTIKHRLEAVSLARFLNGQMKHVSNAEEFLRLSADFRLYSGYQRDPNAIKSAILRFKHENLPKFLQFNPTPRQILEAITIHFEHTSYENSVFNPEYAPDFRSTVASYLSEVKSRFAQDPLEAAAIIFLLERDKQIFMA